MTIHLPQLALLFAGLIALGFICRSLAARGASGAIGPLILGVLSLGSFCLGGFSLWHSYRLVRGASSAQGEVVRIMVSENTTTRSDRNYGDSTETTRTSSPVVRFRPRDAVRDVEFTALGNTDKPAGYVVGDRVGLLYSPEQPEQARLNIFGDLWLPGIVFAAVGAALGAAAWAMGFIWKKISPVRIG